MVHILLRPFFLIALLITASVEARAAEDFAGKTITISVFAGVGGNYDLYARLLSRQLARHIPGNPTILVVNQLGAGGLVSVNYVAGVAPQDGTALALVNDGLPLYEATRQPGLARSLGTFKWIGNLSHSNIVTATWKTSGIRTLADARARDVPVGSTGAGSLSAILPKIYNTILDTRFKVIYGYEGSAQMMAAMERGELDGRGNSTWSSYKSSFPEAIAKGNLYVLVQLGLKKEVDLPDVPLVTDLVAGDARKSALAAFMSQAFTLNRPLAAPPGVPDAVVALLRSGFDATMTDPDFLAEAKKLNLEISPMSGVETQKVIGQILSAPKDVIDTVRSVAGL